MTINPVVLADLTQGKLTGDGVFDVLMKTMKLHLEGEFKLNRIKGPEYATVYLGSLEPVLNSALAFLLGKDKAALEAQLIEKQILLAEAEIAKANAQLLGIQAQTALTEQQLLNLQAELVIIQANALKVPAEIDLLEAKTAQTNQETANLVSQKLQIEAQTAQVTQQTLNLVSQELQIDAQTGLITQQTANAVIEATVLTAQKCKLQAEFDVLMLTKDKTVQETSLLLWKTNSEKGQTLAAGVDADSVIGRQKVLYLRQADGFLRDSEQKAAKLLVDSWSVRRTTDEATPADANNMLYDTSIGRAINKLLSGVGA
jgi:hypothetical protein